MYDFFRDQGSAIAGAATLLVALVSFLLVRATKRLWVASEAEIKVLINSERPWVGPLTVYGPETLSPGENVAASVYVIILNTGRVPAQQMKAHFDGLILVHRCNRMIQSIRVRPRQVAVSSRRR